MPRRDSRHWILPFLPGLLLLLSPYTAWLLPVWAWVVFAVRARALADSATAATRLAWLTLLVEPALLEWSARRIDAPSLPEWRHDGDGMGMTGHATRLWGLAEGVIGNGTVTATINALGVRGPVPPVPRPAGQERVLILGDSTFFGHGIADGETIGQSLVRALAASGIRADAVDGGIPGYSSAQSLLLLDEVGWSLEPSLLLVGNLWSDNTVNGFLDADLLHTAASYGRNPLRHSAFFLLASQYFASRRDSPGARVILWTAKSEWPTNTSRRVPLQEYATNLDLIARRAADRGIGIAFLAPTNQGIVDRSLPPGAAWDPYFAAQQAVADWQGVPVISCLRALQENPAPTSEEFVDVVHPSAVGAAAIAGEAARTLVAAGWPAKRLQGRPEPFDASALVDGNPALRRFESPAVSPQGRLFPDVEGAAAPPPAFKP